jgi:anti-sigma B factor antagonist
MIKLNITKTNGMMVGSIENTDRLNAANAHELKSQLNDALSVKGTRFLLNLENIKFIDSTGIGALISALKTARQNDNVFQLCAIQKDVLSLLNLMKLDKVFDILTEINL